MNLKIKSSKWQPCCVNLLLIYCIYSVSGDKSYPEPMWIFVVNYTLTRYFVEHFDKVKYQCTALPRPLNAKISFMFFFFSKLFSMSRSTFVSFRLIDLTTRHRQETEMETERLRTAQIQAERTLESRERAHRQRVKGLEEQVCGPHSSLGFMYLISMG